MTTKRIACAAAVSAVIASLTITSCNNAPSAAPAVIGEGIRFCESTLPYGDGILIANFGTDALNPLNTEGKGYIVSWANDTAVTLIPADGHLSAPKGMFFRDGYLYICDVNKVAVYRIGEDGSTFVKDIVFPEGNLFVNDLAASGNWLYASVTNTDRIYRIDISDISAPGEPAEWLTIPCPNGIAISEGMMYVASYPADGNTQDKHIIYGIADLDNPQPEKVITVPGQYDGIALSSDGKYLFITNWTPAGLSIVDLKTGTVTPVAVELESPLTGPADITVLNGKIYIPDLPGSRVVVIDEPATENK